ncbi:unnamed protein product [Arabidopsis halleri]
MDLKLLSRDWDHESYPASSDLWVLIFFALVFLSLRLILDRFIFERVARRLVVPRGHYGDSNERRKKIVKFKESAWKSLCSFSVEALALYVTYKEPWFKDTRCFWLGPGDQIWPDQKIKFARIGSVILALHEISDVFLEIGKMCKYSGAEAMTSVSFVLFFLSWTALRLIYYPFLILWSTSYESIKVKMEYWDKKHLMDTGPNLMVFYYVFNTLLYCLQILHIYWWILIYRVLISQIRAKGTVAKDIRSDSEGDDDEHHD